ncbi:transposase [Gluconobacter cerinus]|nr:transposase [Gluconobacter cerinus]
MDIPELSRHVCGVPPLGKDTIHEEVVYIAFFPRYIVGWHVCRTGHVSFIFDALKQALHASCPSRGFGLIHDADCGNHYVVIRYIERLVEAGIKLSVGCMENLYDNALAETINELFPARVIHRRGPWRSFDAVEYAMLEWVDWFNNRRIHEPIGSVTLNEAEQKFYATLDNIPIAARFTYTSLRQFRGGSRT